MYNIKQADVLILGNSHTSAAIDPEIFINYNLKAENHSLGGHYPEFNYYFYNYYRKRFPPPKALIICTSYLLFSASKDELLFSLLDASDFNKRYFKNIFSESLNLIKYKTLFQDFPKFSFNLLSGDKKTIAVGYTTNLNPNFKYHNLSQISYDSENVEKQRNSLSNKKLSTSQIVHDQNSLIYFRKLLSILNQEKVFVLLINPPVYIDAKHSIGYNKAFTDFIRTEIIGYPNIKYIAQEDVKSIDITDRTLFFDGSLENKNSHLSFIGSKMYTNEIIDKLFEVFPKD